MSELRPLRWLLVAPPLIAMAVAACGDDANDRALQLERARQLAEDHRASQATVPPVAAAYGDESVAPPTSIPTVEPTGVVVPVQALDNSFRPQVVEVHVGDEVVWENRGVNDHNVLSIEDGEWGIDVDGFGPGAVYAHVFTEPGEYAYYCSIHGNQQVGMVGTVIVTA
jgi:plastocyanin